MRGPTAGHAKNASKSGEERAVTIPVLDIDPYGAEYLSDPIPAWERMREAGPVVGIEKYGVLACARYARGEIDSGELEGTFRARAALALRISRRRKPGVPAASRWRPTRRSTRAPAG